MKEGVGKNCNRCCNSVKIGWLELTDTEERNGESSEVQGSTYAYDVVEPVEQGILAWFLGDGPGISMRAHTAIAYYWIIW